MWLTLLVPVAAGAVVVAVVWQMNRSRRAAARWATIAQVSVVLADLLHQEATLEDVARLVVPEFADWCTLHLVEEGQVRRAAVAHTDPEIERRFRARLATTPFLLDAPHGPAKVIRTGELELQEATSPESLAGQTDPELFRSAGYGSLISVPLQVRRDTIGALSLHRKARYGYNRTDVEWAQDLARRIALALENARLFADARELFEQSASANWVSTPDGRILACNRLFAELLGFGSIAEALAAPAASLYERVAERQELIDEVAAHRRVVDRETTFKRHDDGRSVYTVVNAVGEFDDRGQLRKLRGFIVDRSAQKDLEDQLRQAQRLEAIGQLAGGIAHDFNNLLTVIIGCADIMAAAGHHPAVSADGHDPLDELMKASRRAASLTQQLLAFSRRQVLEPRLVDLNESLRVVHTMLRRLVHENIVIMLDLDPRIARVRVDPGQLDQVIVNLVINSADALSNGGTISLKTIGMTLTEADVTQRPVIPSGAYVALVVRDNGVGMDEATRARVFEPFFTTKPVGKGTGLGLSTVYGIVKQSGGYVWIESAVGKGTAVTVCLPAQPEAA